MSKIGWDIGTSKNTETGVVTHTINGGKMSMDEGINNAYVISVAPEMLGLLEKTDKVLKLLYPTDIKYVQPEHCAEFEAVHKLISDIKETLRFKGEL